MAKLLGESLASATAQSLSQVPITDQRRDRGGQSGHVAGRNQEPGFVADRNFACAVDVIADHRLAGDQSLGQRPGQTFSIGRMYQSVHRTDHPGHVCRRDQTGEHKVFPQPELFDPLLE